MTGLRVFRRLLTKTLPREHFQEDAALPPVIEAGDFTIDLSQRLVTLGGQQLQLTSEEFDVLVFLASHPQRLITPRTMLNTSWSRNRLRQTEVLRVLLSLRAKLEAADPGKHYLRTEPWVLYRFDSSPAA